MFHISNPNISEYTYDLPNERIAKYPLTQRDTSKLLVYKNNCITNDTFYNCTQYIPQNALLVFNNTKVIHARIFLHKLTGAKIEIFCLEPHSPKQYEQNFSSKNSCSWYCIVGNAKKWKEEVLQTSFNLHNETIILEAKKLEKQEENFIIEFTWNGNISFSEIIEHVGALPIPPYLQRDTEATDEVQYQTIYAKHDGSVAAPTAGLHFTDSVFNALRSQNIQTTNVTLHVGAGTFKPVKSELFTEHAMHHELCIVSKECIQNLQQNKDIIAIGTTSVRTLESLYWLGVKLLANPESDISELSQWEAYSLPQHISKQDALGAILHYLDSQKIDEIKAYTSIMIVPGYAFRIITGLFTNFHQPQSTLLLLISAVVGETWKNIYTHALENDYRFLSFGDSSLLFTHTK